MFTRVRDILKREGFAKLLHRGLTYPGRRNLPGIRYEARYYYEHSIVERDAEDFMPNIREFTFHLVRSNQQADQLEADGYEFRSYQTKARAALDNGAIAFCFFVQKKLAHIGWIALTEEAKPYVDDWLEIDFANREACTGATLTIPEYRGKGLMNYGYYKRFEFLREMGIVKSRASVGIYNTASHRAHFRFHPRIYARARYMKLLWWESWKATPILKAIDPTTSADSR